MTTATMNALRFGEVGALSALAVGVVERPRPLPGEVLVAVRAAGVNPSDVKNVLGAFSYTTLPRTPGRDFAGEVVEGPKALLGLHVFGTGKELGFTRDGSHAEYLTMPEDALAPKPRALTFAQAAAVGVPYVTAFDALDRGRVDAGTRLLVIGARGAVGTAAVHLANARGARVAGAVRDLARASELEAAGIPLMPLTDAEAFPEQARTLLGGAPQVIFDTTGHWLAASVHALAPFGRVLVIAPGPSPRGLVELPVLDLYRRGGVIVGINSLLYDVRASARMLAQLGARFDDLSLAPPAAPTERPLLQGALVYEAVHRARGEKYVLT